LRRPGTDIFSDRMSHVTVSNRGNWVFAGIFCVALIAHFYLTTANWRTPFMPGHEFRQAQTALISYYIDKQNNFSPLYETPVLGKPWVSILLEVPVYEWSVVWLSRLAHIPHFMAARTVSLTCFYLALPAFYLLLGRLSIERSRRLLVLALILTSPVYIFYSRAFLMESMELMCCAWFLLGFVRTMDERRLRWLALTIVAGTGAALIKSATFAVWLIPAAAYGAWCLWSDFRLRRGPAAVVKTLLWGAATVVVAFGFLRWWIAVTDPIKAAHASAWIFTSKNLSQGNWGLLNFAARFSVKTWGILLERWREAVMSPWVVGAYLVAGLAAFREIRWRSLGTAAVFFLAQLLFPFAYAYQDYYFYACAVFLLAGLGIIFLGLLDSRTPRILCVLLIAVPFIAQLLTYWNGYRVQQMLVSNGGFNYTEALKELCPENSVIIVAGADWAAMVPYYSQRKALMIRNGLEFDGAYIRRAMDDLADEDVSALVLIGDLRYNQPLLQTIAARFNFDPSAPTFSQTYTDIYFSRPYIDGVQLRLRSSLKYPELKFTPRNKPSGDKAEPFAISSALARSSFPNISPAPFQARFTFGLDRSEFEGQMVLSTHPDTDLWLTPAPAATTIEWDFGMFPAAYERAGDKTDGVEFQIMGETVDGNRREIYRRLLDPLHVAGDRGKQHQVIPYQPRKGEVLIFSDRPNKSYSYDWTYWSRIEVK